MPGNTFSYRGITIRVDVDSTDDLEWLHEFLHPWFQDSDGKPDCHVQYRVDRTRYRRLLDRGPSGGPARAFMMDTRVIEYPRWQAWDGECLLFDEEHRLFFLIRDSQVEIIAARAERRSRVRLMRAVREFAMGAAQAGGGRFLHAAALAAGNRSLAITGRRTAGKTTLLIYLLSHLDAGFVANDRLLVHKHKGAVSIRGMPTVVSVRAGTLALFPRLHGELQHRCFTTRLSLRECAGAAPEILQDRRGDKWGLSPAQLCAATASEPIREARADVLLLPRRTGRPGGVKLRELHTAEARKALTDGLFGHIGPDHLSDAFTLPGLRVTPPTDDEFLATLSTSFSVFECQLGDDAYTSPDGAAKIGGLLQ